MSTRVCIRFDGVAVYDATPPKFEENKHKRAANGQFSETASKGSHPQPSGGHYTPAREKNSRFEQARNVKEHRPVNPYTEQKNQLAAHREAFYAAHPNGNKYGSWDPKVEKDYKEAHPKEFSDISRVDNLHREAQSEVEKTTVTRGKAFNAAYESTRASSRTREFTKSEIKATVAYQNSGAAEKINKAMREGKALNDKQQALVKELDSGIAASKLDEDVHVYRGLSGKAADKLLADLKPGQTISSPGFTSVSFDEGVAAGFGAGKNDRDKPLLMRILAPKGTNMLLTGDRGSNVDMGQQEYEGILPRNAKLKFEGSHINNGATVYNFTVA